MSIQAGPTSIEHAPELPEGFVTGATLMHHLDDIALHTQAVNAASRPGGSPYQVPGGGEITQAFQRRGLTLDYLTPFQSLVARAVAVEVGDEPVDASGYLARLKAVVEACEPAAAGKGIPARDLRLTGAQALRLSPLITQVSKRDESLRLDGWLMTLSCEAYDPTSLFSRQFRQLIAEEVAARAAARQQKQNKSVASQVIRAALLPLSEI